MKPCRASQEGLLYYISFYDYNSDVYCPPGAKEINKTLFFIQVNNRRFFLNTRGRNLLVHFGGPHLLPALVSVFEFHRSKHLQKKSPNLMISCLFLVILENLCFESRFNQIKVSISSSTHGEKLHIPPPICAEMRVGRKTMRLLTQ